jgi:hypothetical protein
MGVGINIMPYVQEIDEYLYIIDSPKRSDKLKAKELVESGKATGYSVHHNGDAQSMDIWFASEEDAMRYILEW